MCVWVEDADKLEIDSRELDIVFYNRIVKNFINENSTLGLAGVKGQGKTFLIKVKRKRIEEQGMTICFPRHEMVDTMDSSLIIDKSLINYLKDYNIWVDLWKFSISGAIVTSNEISCEFDLSDIKRTTKRFLDLANKRSEPTYFLRQLLRGSIHDVESFLSDTSILFEKLKDVRQSVCFFIDKLDQGFSKYIKLFNEDTRLPVRSRNASFWQYAQYALAECAYDLFSNINKHIKVYFTIRQESMLDCELLNKDKARNINAYIQTLQYSQKDLRGMYDLYISKEEKRNLVSIKYADTEPSKAFVGIEEFAHGYIQNRNENVFDYIYRHSFKRPYDIMKICYSLSMSVEPNEIVSVKQIRHIVNKESNKLLKLYLQELSIFMPCSVLELERVIGMIPSNVMDKQMIQTICSIFRFESEENSWWNCNQKCSECDDSFIFTVLYNLGLLGYYKKHEADINSIINFENIGNGILEIKSFTLPKSKHYFLHPAVSNKARDLRGNLGLPFFANNNAVIGDGCEIAGKRITSSSLKKYKNQIMKESVFVSSTVYDLGEERVEIKKILTKQGLHPRMSETEEFDIANSHSVHSHDHCLNEVKKCKSFIFIIGSTCGGEYNGILYQKEKEEIIELSNGKILNPSISLMEYYLARKEGHVCYVYSKCDNQEKKKQGRLDKDLKAEIDFINHFKLSKKGNIQGNWIVWYKDIDDLKNRIRKNKFS